MPSTTLSGGLARAVYEQSRRSPRAPAVSDSEVTLDYAGLDARAASVATALRDHGVRPGDAVCVGVPRSWQLVCVMLGVLRLGACVVPVDLASPPVRRDRMLTDSGAGVFIHGGDRPRELPAGVRPLFAEELLASGGKTQDVPEPPVTAPAVSFLFYTSGTSGRPKGVEVRDAGILRLARSGLLVPRPGARFGCLANPAFDALSFEVWVPLLTGGCCVILGDEEVQTPERLAEVLVRRRVDAAFVTTALFHAVVDTVPDCFSGLERLFVGGEALNARLVRRWYRDNPGSRTQLHNIYGPTESTTFALCHPIPRDFDAPVVPIGGPLAENGTALVVPDSTRPAAAGEVAELLLSGAGLAAGYRNLPEETARRFVTLPGNDGACVRHYRTGDLVRRDEHGDLVYVGRADRQVKIRGFRVEPGELEQHITEHPAVRQAFVCTRRSGESGPQELLCYLVVDDGLSWEEFDRHLAAGLPASLRPHHLYRVAALPLNANGKVDRAALLARTDPPWRPASDSTEAVGGVRGEVLELAGAVLGVPDPGAGDRWIACGGDSLKALRLRFEIRRRFGRELPQSLVLHGTLGDVAEAVAAADPGQADAAGPPPVTVAGARSAPATSEQQRLWLLQQRSPRSRAYDVLFAFRVEGAVDPCALRRALAGLVVRHPALRTGFEATADGLRQTVGEPYDPWTDPPDAWVAREPQEVHEAFRAEPFELDRPRMLRACWLPASDGRQEPEGQEGGTLLLHLHHIAVDGWSTNVLLRDLSAGYAAALDGRDDTATQPSAAPTPLDFAVWQSSWHSGPGYAAQRDALLAHYAALGEDPEPLPPAYGDDPASPSPAGPSPATLLRTSVDPAARTALDRLCGELGLTRFQVLLAVYSWALYGVTGRTRPRIAAPVAGRPVREFEDSVGMFANTLLLPVTVAPREDLRQQVLRLGGEVRQTMEQQDVALADVLRERTAAKGGRPPFDFLFVLENTDFDALSLPGCASRPLWPVPAEAKCPVTLSVVQRPDGLECLWEFAAEHLDEDRAKALTGLFHQALAALTEDGGGTPADLVAPYRARWARPGGDPPAVPSWTTVAEGFARQVALTPSAPAVVSGGGTLDYAALDAHAAALAAELRETYALPDGQQPCHIALFLEPSTEHVVALLALARLNVTAVPLDPSYPAALLRQVLELTDPVCVLLPPGDRPEFDAVDPGGTARHPVILSDAAVPPQPAHQGARPLYTLFTSGSTGTPKGVRVFDRTLCNLLCWQAESDGPGAPAATQQFSMLSFDVSFQEIFGTLCTGGRLHLLQPALRHEMPALLDQLESAGIERLYLPYVALRMLAEHAVHLGRYPARLREVITAGEQLVCTDAVRRWFAGLPEARLFNHYGPTETHVVSSLCLEGDPARWPDRPAIGRPIGGALLRVVDEAGLPVPPGQAGELLIGGVIDTPCYLDDPPLNRERFTELPGEGLFHRSGDLARFDRAGLLHWLGRADEQIKLSGHRLEPGQVEEALLRHPAVAAAAVALDGSALVACLESRGTAPGSAALREHLAGLLPAHARVDRFRLLTRLPRTPSGKTDRRAALRAPGTELGGGLSAAPPPAGREAALAALFTEVTGASIGRDQTYFAAGASSLDLMRFHLRCTTELGLRFTVADLFEQVTVRELARFLEDVQPATAPDGSPASEAVEAVEAVDAVEAIAAGDPVAVIGMAVRTAGAPDLAAFWDLVVTGRSGIEHFEAADGLVGARSQPAGLLAFDPERFGISRREARLMDPQQRQLLMTCVEALAHAGISDPAAVRAGLVAGAGENTYFQAMLREGDTAQLPDGFQLALHHDKDFLATKAAYHLGLTGPVLTAQTACSSSLVAVHLAAGLLRQGDAGVMLAGGVLVDTGMSEGYRYRPQHIFSADGHCRPFSDDAGGTVGGSGSGVVVLKPLSRAREDGDTVYAVISGSAVNNDGAAKLSYSAPSLAGQREVIRTALRRSGRRGSDIGYVEAHGTGTRLGDPVEAGALRQALDVADTDRLVLSSVKSQIGHLGAAAGVVGLIRAVLSVHHGVIPPTPGFRALNPEIGPGPAAFHVPAESAPWPEGRERVAAVSSFGIGGTNAHLVLEAADRAPAPAADDPVPLLVLSAPDAEALRADAARIAGFLERRPDAFGQVLRHLQAGRPQAGLRIAGVCHDPASAATWLRSANRTPADTTGSAGAAQPATRAADQPASALAELWLAGGTLLWPDGPAQAPWDFPPPAFHLDDYDFPRAAPATAEHAPSGLAPEPALSGPVPSRAAPASEAPEATGAPGVPARRPEQEWLHQPQWVRLRSAGPPRTATPRVLVVVAEGPPDPAVLEAFRTTHRRVMWVGAAEGYARLGTDLFAADPADPDQLERVLDALEEDGAGGIDWLHTLPLGIDGPVGTKALDRAVWACLDTPAALVRAVAGRSLAARLRPCWLSCGSRPVHGTVERPEAALLAGVTEVAPQEGAPPGHWVDVPGPHAWATPLAALLSEEPDEAEPLPRQLALRQGHWWESVTLPVRAAADPRVPAVLEDGDHLVLGGTGGLGTAVAGWLLEHTKGRVLLLARSPKLPEALARWADRVETIEADLAAETPRRIADRIASRTARPVSLVHAAGVAAGGLIARRDTTPVPAALAAKLRGALLMELLIERYRPALALYCSSMSAGLGGVGQFDYAAANAVLGAFAHHAPGEESGTARVAVDWDVWRETGMAVRALPTDPRHRAHLQVGLTVAEGQRVLARALDLRLPHLLVSTTDLADSRVFYTGAGTSPSPAAEAADASADVPGLLTERLSSWLGVEHLDPDQSLYDLGADSLTLLNLIETVDEHFGVELDLASLSHRVSLTEVVTRLDEARSADPGQRQDPRTVPLEVWQRGAGRDVVCLVHPVGGDIQSYRSLASALSPGTTVALIADPGLRQPDAPRWTLAERAHRYAEALRARFPDTEWRWHLAGWSFGAWVAAEMAAWAEAAESPARSLHLLDPPPPGSGAVFQAYDETQLKTVFEAEIGLGGESARSSEQAAGYADRLARCCRDNLRSMAGHQVSPLTATATRLWLAEQSTEGLPSLGTPREQLMRWRTFLPKTAEAEVLPTTHYGAVRSPHIEAVADAINAAADGPPPEN
ncbi:amino acid adenylation domain-containing protein [Streptomyces sp. NPDC055239]